MTVFLFGVNHNTASTELRERLVVHESDIPHLLTQTKRYVSEAAVISTCNRTELYAVSDTDRTAELIHILSEHTGVPFAEICDHGYSESGERAVHHLMSVAAGVDSVVIGEPQILTQVKDAWDLARGAATAKASLNTLFRFAIEAGKDVRSHTVISRGATSVAHAAVEIARKELQTLQGLHVLVIGAGQTGKLAALNLKDAGVGKLSIVNRTWDRARALADDIHGEAISFGSLAATLKEADVVITCSSTRDPLITAPMLQEAAGSRHGSPLLVVDIAVPRNVESESREVPGVLLFDMDDIQRLCNHNKHVRAMEARRAERNIQEWTGRYTAWERERSAVPYISRLRSRGEEIRSRELRKAMHSLGELSDRELNAIQAMSKAIVNDLLHDPTIWLKEQDSEVARKTLVHAMGLTPGRTGRRTRDADQD